ncbi:hypothetical protein [Halalkalibacter alkalisediminis]|uniref:Uncharacterized protein n=1 Tax=Halalkalibacter alkalisediminis TaxID=935616 RepID=A0ABV6NDF8_9BACI|nr:hypothetical protein [Halalkalibacter alkalisediminis]
MNGEINYPRLRRSFEKILTRKTNENERLFIKWLIQRSKKAENAVDNRKIH